MKSTWLILALMGLTLATAPLGGCEERNGEGPMERLGKDLDRAGEKVGDAVEDAADDTRDAIERNRDRNNDGVPD